MKADRNSLMDMADAKARTEHLEFLDKLRKSGVTNMFGARSPDGFGNMVPTCKSCGTSEDIDTALTGLCLSCEFEGEKQFSE